MMASLILGFNLSVFSTEVNRFEAEITVSCWKYSEYFLIFSFEVFIFVMSTEVGSRTGGVRHNRTYAEVTRNMQPGVISRNPAHYKYEIPTYNRFTKLGDYFPGNW